MSKTAQVGFRCTPEMAERLREIAFNEKTSAQAILEQSLDLWFQRRGESAPSAFSGISPTEERYLEEFLEALRDGDPDLVDSIRQMVRSTVRLARKHAKPARKRAVS
ncbi:MAG: hypothetical protein H6509_06500 [Bryobacterales bacterium]|nr:hypothetical protein [Acidobacteriota bacterium]MCB9384245.1 hypothetical protein [Bryobacterales bacterium]